MKHIWDLYLKGIEKLMKIFINGEEFSFGSSFKEHFKVDFDGENVWVNSKKTAYNKTIKELKIDVEGDLVSLDTTGNVDIKGDINGNVDITGNLNCKTVNGNVDITGILNGKIVV